MTETPEPPPVPSAPAKRRGLRFWLLIGVGALLAVCIGGAILVRDQVREWAAIANAPEAERGALLSKKLEGLTADRLPVINGFLAAVDEGRDDDAWAMVTDSFRATTTREEFGELTALVRSVVGRCTSKELRTFNTRNVVGSSTVTTLVFAAKFEKGDGTISMDVESSGGEWKVRGWNTNSPLFTEAMKRGAAK
jgi:Protein of unknown function (DUF4019)